MKELDSYLNDHLAGSVGALELTAHWTQLHRGKPLGIFFSQIDAEIRADQNVLRNLCSVFVSATDGPVTHINVLNI